MLNSPVMIDLLSGLTPLQTRLLSLTRALEEDPHASVDAKELLWTLARVDWKMDEAEFEYQCESLNVRVEPMDAYLSGSVGYAYRQLLQMGAPWHCRYPYFNLGGMYGDLHDDEPAGPEGISLSISHFCEEVFPAGKAPRLPLGLLNGGVLSTGVRLPSHHLNELWMAYEQVRQTPDISLESLMEILPGPDFAVPSVCTGVDAIRSLYEHGHAALTLVARIDIELEGGRTRLAITSLPPGVRVKTIIEQIRQLKESHALPLYEVKNSARLNEVRITLDAPGHCPAARIQEVLFQKTDLSVTQPCALSSEAGGLIALLKDAATRCISAWERKDGHPMDWMPTVQEVRRTGGYKSPLTSLIDPRRSRVRHA
jgi:hypothetical protein